jgi:hypothetical protein
MLHKMWPVYLIVIVAGVFMLAITLYSISVTAQKAERGTTQWQIPLDGTTFSGPLLRVVDTTGVCLYVMQGGAEYGARVAVAAVPKTQLPAGTGCQ